MESGLCPGWCHVREHSPERWALQAWYERLQNKSEVGDISKGRHYSPMNTKQTISKTPTTKTFRKTKGGGMAVVVENMV